MKINLNLEQRKAVRHDKGPLLIVAGAGTGKTTVITERIKWLIETKRAKPSEILALTFTERAAQEMEERVDVALPMGYTQTWILTFHAFCERILRQEAVQIGLDPDFKVMSEAESYLFVKEHLFEFDLDYFRPKGNPVKFVSGLITHFARLKDDDVGPKEYSEFVSSKSQNPNSKEEKEELKKLQELANAYTTYETLKVENSRMDFADLISNTLKLFRQRPNVLQRYQEKFKYVLLDEFQDTNYAQNHLAIMLAGNEKNITAVADDDQAVYRWRGAAVYNVLDFKKHFPKAETVVLTQNYRSQQYILDHAYKLIQHNNPNRLEVTENANKKLVSQPPKSPNYPEYPKLIWEDRGEDEAEVVVQEIQKLVESEAINYDYKDFAILIRANSYAEGFTRALGRFGIPYQFLGPGRLFKRPEIRDLIAYLKVLARFDNDEAMYRVLNSSVFGFSGRQTSALVNHARKYNQSLFESAEQIPQYEGLTGMIHRHMELVSHESSGQILYYFLKDTGQLSKLGNPQSEEDVKRVENISRFFNKIKAYETLNPESRVHDFVEYLDFLVAAGESPLASEVDWSEENAVNVITIHSAKGLEFPVVFMVNLVNLRFPSMNRSDQIPVPEEIVKEPEIEGDIHEQEERRLFYVGMTRAKERLYLSGAKFYGDAKRPKKLSGFVREALGENLEKYYLKREAGAPPTLFDFAQLPVEPKDSTPTPTQPPQPTQRRVNYLSYSRISDFQICPLHYKLKHILRIPTAPSGALSYGNAIHNALRDFYKQSTYDLPVLYDLYDKYWSPIGFESKVHEKERYAAGKKQLAKFYEREDWEKINTIAVEQPFTIKLAEDLKVGGRIDRVDKLSDGTLEIIDYKTGRLKEKKDLEKDLQLAIYALAAHHPNVYDQPLEKLKMKYYYLEAGEWIELERSVEDLDKAKEEILKIRDEIESSNFKCSHSYLCQQGCEFSLFCLERE